MYSRPFNLRRPILRSRLLLSTALIGIGTLVAPAIGQGQDYYLDNTQGEGQTGWFPVTGSWSPADKIWFKDGNGVAREWKNGVTAVLTKGANSAGVILTYTGDESIVPEEIRLDSGSYTLAGGVIGEHDKTVRLNNQAGPGESLTVSAALAGSIIIGDGEPEDSEQWVHYTGNSQSSGDTRMMDDLTVETGARFSSTGTTTGELKNFGRTDLDGSHIGDVTNLDGAELSGSGTIKGALENDSGIIHLSNETLSVTNGVQNSIHVEPETPEEEIETIPSATLNGYGRIAGTVTNHLKGEIETGSALDDINGVLGTGYLANHGTITINNQDTLDSPDVGNFGDLYVKGTGVITGNLTQEDGSTLNLDTDGVLVVGSFTNNFFDEPKPGHEIFEKPTVIIDDGKTLRTSAPTAGTNGNIVNNGVMVVENGTLEATGQILNNPGAGLLLNDATIIGNLVNNGGPDEEMGTIRVKGNTETDITGRLTNDGLINLTTNQSHSTLRVINPDPANPDDGGGVFLNNGKIDVRVTHSSTLTIEAKTIRLGKESDIDVGAVVLDGVVTNSGDLTYLYPSAGAKLFGMLTNTESGILEFRTEVVGGNQNIVNRGRMTVEATDDGSRATLEDLGTLDNWDSLTVSALEGKIGMLSATIVNNYGDMTLAGGSITALDSFINTPDGQIWLDGGLITAGLQNAGTLQGAGTIDGDLINTGSLLDLSGEITGRLTYQGGTIDIDESLSAGSLTNNDKILIEVGDTLSLTSMEDSENNDRITVSGALSADGDINNNTGAVLILSDGTIDGDVVNAGRIRGSGTITGAVTITAGDPQADPAVPRGQLIVGEADTMTIAGDIKNSGLIVVSGALSTERNLDNEDGGVVRLNGGTITGAVRNNDGGLVDIRSSSTISGSLTNNGTIKLSGVGVGATLDIDGNFTNASDINVGDESSFLTIIADEIALNKGSTIDVDRVELIGTVLNSVNLNYSEDGAISGDLINNAAGQITISADVDGQGSDIDNRGSLLVTSDADSDGNLHDVGALTNSGGLIIEAGRSVSADKIMNEGTGQMQVAGRLISAENPVVNEGDLDVSGAIDGNLKNSGGTTTLSDGTINGDVRNSAKLTGTATINGALSNTPEGKATLGGTIGEVKNAGLLTTGGDLSVTGLKNTGRVEVNGEDTLQSDSMVNNQGTLWIAGTLEAGLNNKADATTDLSGGKIVGSMTNSGALNGSGVITGKLTHSQSGTLNIDGKLSVDSLLNDGKFLVGSDDTLSATNGVDNNGRITVAGALAGDVDNSGYFGQSGLLDGSLVTTGEAVVGGTVTGDLDYLDGTLALSDGVNIGGTLSLGQNYILDNAVNAKRTHVLQDVQLRLGGRLTGNLVNDGIVVAGNGAEVGGVLHNNEIVSLQGADRTGDVLTTGGLSGNGIYALDVNLSDFTADRIDVRGGAATGHYELQLNYIGEAGATRIGERVALLNVEDGLGAQNNFTYSYNPTDTASEKLVYSVEQDGAHGDVYLINSINPAIGAVFGNVKLTQSLIGSVVNRPTSPFVTGLAFEDPEKPCGVGSWGRGTGGYAKATGATDNGVSKIDSTVDATYYGMQVGTDFACFDNRYAGWNMSFGGFLGVNQGDTTQPVYAVDGRDSRNVTRQLRSRNEVDFDQLYAGIYATATKGRMQADLQYRYERTDFTIENKPVTGAGLGLDKADFASTGGTLSGSFSYLFSVGDDGWTVVPNVALPIRACRRIRSNSRKASNSISRTTNPRSVSPGQRLRKLLSDLNRTRPSMPLRPARFTRTSPIRAYRISLDRMTRVSSRSD
ncbi:hypothetical protein [Paracoccus methylarcula]|uniref:Autotransporter domain-containing protein n=1 Tax=Paracoccus methylarcula TaxID=72022 RepID=A0A3R7P4F7_9RHOB|nr:hypothetical protein [Paracoccus methylarcula]RNF34464.1 hypothetical protein A7A09_011285 [Paracoccus methylarcula]